MFRFVTILVILLIENSYERPVKTISISSANNYLSLQLFQHLSNEEKNVFYSPFSISSAFGMLYLGARDKTAEEMKEVLGYNFGHLSNDEVNQQFGSILREISDKDSNKYQLNIANKLVAQQNFDILESYICALDQ
jgi:serpin B